MSKADMIEAAQRRINGGYSVTPEHSGLTDDGRPMPIERQLLGGGMVVDRDTLKAQSEPQYDEVSVFSPERPAIEAQREAAAKTARDVQKDAEAAEKARPASERGTQPPREDDKPDDQPAI